MIRTLNDTFYINPLPYHVTRSIKFNAGQPHVIYRRSIEDLSSTYHTGTNSLVLLAVVFLLFLSLIITEIKMISAQHSSNNGKN